MSKFIMRLSEWHNSAKRVVLGNWYGPKMYQTSTKEIEQILEKKFPQAIAILVDDKSGGCGAMFEIYVESNEFKNLPIYKQHKLIYDALKDQIKVIHGLRVITKVP